MSLRSRQCNQIKVGQPSCDFTSWETWPMSARPWTWGLRIPMTLPMSCMLEAPVSAIAALTRAPATGLLVLLAGVLTMGIATLVHLVTLPVEWDASFRRALPVLEQGGYVSAADMEGARRILTAAAFTYVAASLASLLSLWRWLAFLRR